MLFWNSMMRSDNIILRTLSQFRRNSAMVGSVYNVDVFQRSHTGIKNAGVPSLVRKFLKKIHRHNGAAGDAPGNRSHRIMLRVTRKMDFSLFWQPATRFGK